MIATIPSATLVGVDGHRVAVEVHVSNGLPGLSIVGLPDAACREARDRVRSALLSSGLTWPMRRMTVNLAPSSVRKVGAGLDLAIAMGLLVASGFLAPNLIEGMGFLGELGLDGSVRPIHGVVPLVEALTGRGEWADPPPSLGRHLSPTPELADVQGQPLARWALEVAAAGGHNLLMTGSPGSGKTMLASRLPGLLPDLDPATALMTTRVHSAAGLLSETDRLVERPPFRAPHHTASMVSLVGGGSGMPRPGEVSLAHGGVLFLDEMVEFPRSVLDVLRQPLEEGEIRLSRAYGTVAFPARFQLIGALNPCPCGDGVYPGACRCPVHVRERYRAKLSGPLLDRFDLRITVQRPRVEQFFEKQSASETTSTVAERVAEARVRAQHRGVRCNADLTVRQLQEAAPLAPDAAAVLRSQMQRGLLTGRGLHRVRRVALTLADLDGGSPVLRDHHVCAALELRPDNERLEKAS